jgi:hypothetical protein
MDTKWALPSGSGNRRSSPRSRSARSGTTVKTLPRTMTLLRRREQSSATGAGNAAAPSTPTLRLYCRMDRGNHSRTAMAIGTVRTLACKGAEPKSSRRFTSRGYPPFQPWSPCCCSWLNRVAASELWEETVRCGECYFRVPLEIHRNSKTRPATGTPVETSSNPPSLTHTLHSAALSGAIKMPNITPATQELASGVNSH